MVSLRRRFLAHREQARIARMDPPGKGRYTRVMFFRLRSHLARYPDHCGGRAPHYAALVKSRHHF